MADSKEVLSTEEPIVNLTPTNLDEIGGSKINDRFFGGKHPPHLNTPLILSIHKHV